LKPNYQYILELVQNASSDTKYKNAKILDFGCGVGEVVESGLDMSLDIYGADTFEGYYENWKDNLPSNIKDRISQIQNNKMEYDDNTFDFVISNQVFEHIRYPLDSYKEIARVLKPGGIFYAIFPNKSCWYEGHIGLYFPHWFKRKSELQRKYVSISYDLGLGRKRHMGKDGWMHVLNDVTFHHPIRSIKADIKESFDCYPKNIAHDFMKYRISNSRFSKFKIILNNIIFAPVLIFFARIRAGSVLKVINDN
tara:strand:+ start:1776 stop:2531 length:756 start_codon:yes stop_codon:yes gene_type:complete